LFFISGVGSHNPIHTAEMLLVCVFKDLHQGLFSSTTTYVKVKEGRKERTMTYHSALFVASVNVMRHGQDIRNRRSGRRMCWVAMIEHVDECDGP
jgi:hypothetical protein